MGREEVMWFLTRLLKHFMMTEVKATGWYSFSSVTFPLLGIQIIVDLLKKVGITA